MLGNLAGSLVLDFVCCFYLEKEWHNGIYMDDSGDCSRRTDRTIKEALLKLEPHGQNAPGSIRYEHYQSEENPTQFMHFSIWETEADKDRFDDLEVHVEILGSLPEETWVSPPTPTVLQSLA